MFFYTRIFTVKGVGTGYLNLPRRLSPFRIIKASIIIVPFLIYVLLLLHVCKTNFVSLELLLELFKHLATELP